MEQINFMRNIKGSFILFLTAFIWGTTFVAQVNGTDNIGVFTYNASRCYVGCLFLLFVSIIKDKINFGKKDEMNKGSKWPVKGGILCGLVMFIAMAAQQGGISLYPDNVAAAGRAGFLTAIYVVIVAVVVSVASRKINAFVTISVIGTVIGMYLLCLKDGFSGIYKGDILCLACAFCFAGHILVVDKFKGVDSIKLSCIQFLVAGTMSLVICLITEKIVVADIVAVAMPILYAGILSSGVAYTLQMIGQKYAEPAVAAIVMSLESVIAVISGAVILHEVLAGREIAGCIVVFASVIIAQVPEVLKREGE